jgi:hypothetical protein
VYSGQVDPDLIMGSPTSISKRHSIHLETHTHISRIRASLRVMQLQEGVMQLQRRKYLSKGFWLFGERLSWSSGVLLCSS